MPLTAIGACPRYRIGHNNTRRETTHRVRFNGWVFVDHEDVCEHMGLDECLVLVRYRAAPSSPLGILRAGLGGFTIGDRTICG